jgi:hypothetical protein
MIDNWHLDEKAKDLKTFDTHDGRLQAINHIIKNIFNINKEN